MLSKRINSIESVRFIAAFAVICIHYFNEKGNSLLIVNQISRFAVPFFFVVSGFFLAEKLKKEDKFIVYWKYFKKLLFLYLAWQLIYFINPPRGDIYIYGFAKAYSKKFHGVFGSSWEYFFQHADVIFRGFAQHLWFFASLAITTLYFFLFRLKRVYLMVAISAVLYVIGALTKAYMNSKIGIPVESMRIHMSGYWYGFPDKFNTNNLIFFSALPFSLGVMLSAKNIRVALMPAILILLVGYALHFTEVWYLGQIKLKQRVDYGFSTFLMGLGFFLVAKAKFKPLEFNWLANLGKYSLGIYAMHVLIANYLYELIFVHIKPYPTIFFCLTILVACTLVTFILSKIPVVKKLL